MTDSLPSAAQQPQPLRIVLPLPSRPLLYLTLIEPIGPGTEPQYRQRILQQPDAAVHRPHGPEAEAFRDLFRGQEVTITQRTFERLCDRINEAERSREISDVAAIRLLTLLCGREEATAGHG